MNLLSIVLGCIIVFAISMMLLYAANFSSARRYKQVWLPFIALLICFPLLQWDERIIGLYERLLGDKWPFLLSYVQLLFNLTFLISFLTVKWAWRLAGSLSSKSLGKKVRWLQRVILFFEKIGRTLYPKALVEQWKSRLFEPGTVSLVYTKSRGKLFLKKEWTYLSTFFKLASVIPILLLVLLIVANIYTLPLIDYLPNYPVISYVLLSEIAWFLSGRRYPFTEGSIGGKDAINRRLVTYEELFEQYKELWEERLLTAGIVKENEHFHHRTQHFAYENLSSNREHQMIINAICAKLKKKNLIIDESYTTMMSEMIQEHDVMMEDVLYEEFSAYFFPALYHLLTKNKKILVIAPNQSVVEDAVEWFTKGIREVSGLDQVWRVSTYLDALEQNTNSDILIISPDVLEEKRFLHYLSQLEKTKILEGIMLLHAEKLLPNYSTILHAFNLNVRELIGKKPQYIIVSEWYEGLEHTVRSVLQCEPRDIVASANPSQNLHYMVWKKEGEKWFQHTVLPKISHRQLETEVILALPALKANIEPVHFVNQRRTNVKESIGEIMDAKKSLFDLGFDLETLDQFLNMIKIHDKTLGIPVDDFAFLLVRDNQYNLVDSLNLWKGNGKVASFVHIVSPPYLIRDYLADQLEFYMTTNRTVAPLVPRLSQSVWSIAYYLLERLCHFYVSDVEVEGYLARAKINAYKSVVEGIHQLFTQAFGPVLEYRFNIESEEYLAFDRSKRDFVTKTQYRIPYSAKEKILPKGFRFIEIRHNNKTISEIFEGHVYQQYLPGQFHSFNGELFKIQKVDLEHGFVEVSFEPIFERKYYRPLTEFVIRNLKEERYLENKNISLERFDIRLSALQAEVGILTSGYVELSHLLNLKSMKVHTFHQEEEIQRQYANGHLICLEIRSREGAIENAARIEFTLALLLNELFLSLFPDTHHFVKACARLDERFFNQEQSFSKKLGLITPSLKVHRVLATEEGIAGAPAQEDGGITLYMIEDSPFHLGILEAIRDNWEKIFDLLNDYLYWLLHESKGESDYLHFGYGQYPEELALAETFMLINELLTRKKLREVRTEYLGRVVEGDIFAISNAGNETQCVFCGRKFGAAQFHQLDDGRQRCFTCSQSGIDQVSLVEPLYKQVREFFMKEYQAFLPLDIDLSVLSTAEIHKLSGLGFVPEAGHSRIAGKASRDELGNLTVLIENGSPRVHTLATLAHELTHIWQYEKLAVSSLTLEEIEGFASWVEVDTMTKIGETPYANMLKGELMQRQDEYGKGYRLIEEKLAGMPEGTTPFELYLDVDVDVVI
jgi:hypothetical protein